MTPPPRPSSPLPEEADPEQTHISRMNARLASGHAIAQSMTRVGFHLVMCLPAPLQAGPKKVQRCCPGSAAMYLHSAVQQSSHSCEDQW